MRQITIDLYPYNELDAAAQEAARDWYRTNTFEVDNDDLERTIAYALGSAIGDPNVVNFGEGDYDLKKSTGLEVTGWDLDRGAHVLVKGYLDRSNAPALPWHDSIDGATLAPSQYWVNVSIDLAGDADAPAEVVTALDDAVTDALHKAYLAGRDELEYLNSDEHIDEILSINEYEFRENGIPA